MNKLKALLISGSPRENGNTELMLKKCSETLAMSNIDSEIIRIFDYTLKPCVACRWCSEHKNKKCLIQNDDFQIIFEKFLESEIIVAGTPVYFGSATSQLKLMLDRVGYVSRSNGNLLSRKIGAPFVVSRRAGHDFTYSQIILWYAINDFFIVGPKTIGFGAEKGDVIKDIEAMNKIDRFCENIVYASSKLF